MLFSNLVPLRGENTSSQCPQNQGFLGPLRVLSPLRGNPHTIAMILSCDGSIRSLQEKLRDLWEAEEREPGIEYGFHVKAERFF